jgi:DNA-binding NtrC family response regulator
MRKKTRILIVDDELAIRLSLAAWLRRDGHEVEVAEGGRAALEALRAQSFDVLISDMKMPGMSGQELLAQVANDDPELPVVMMTAYGSIESAVQAMKGGAVDYVVKPFDPLEIGMLVTRILDDRRLRREHELLKHRVRDLGGAGLLIGGSPSMAKVFELIDDVAAADSVVLITGESGTGKELVARAIHQKSTRAQGPFVGVNFGAFTETLLESELFGHEKGAFTGAVAAKQGLFELAAGGTLFLDEIGDASPKLQIDLLRVLQERKFRRVGGLRDLEVAFRLLSATNRDLARAVEEGTFRRDLYYRLNVIQLHVPALRERREDIPVLAEHFLEKLRVRLNRRVTSVSPEALALLQHHDWPGNVRELENAVERAVVVGKEARILPRDLPISLQGMPCPEPADESLEAWEKIHVLRLLEKYAWNISQTAQALQIDRGTLYAKIKKYGLQPPE